MTKYDHELIFKDFHEKRISGKLYQQFFLYPKLRKNITGKLIDVGSGLGDFCIFYKNSVAVDINKHAVNFCKDRFIEAKMIVNDNIDYEDETFNSALMDNVLEHILDPDKLIMEVHRVLKKRGRLLIGVPGIKGFEMDFDHKVFYDEVNLIGLFDKFNFKLIKKFFTPFHSDYLNQNLKSYCLYCVFEKV